METLITPEDLVSLRDTWKSEGSTIAFVPTMGALHDGHLHLMLEGKRYADKVIASIFVNPKQFGPNEDFAKYPRTLADDIEKLTTVGVDGVFLPNAAEIYPEGFQTYLTNRGMAQDLCGLSRPGHFDGVLTIVLKLLNIVAPHHALFGKKDYQQFQLITAMVRDLCLPLEVVGCETVREVDGLAMSSRNRYLTAADREKAVNLYRSLEAAQALYKSGERHVDALTNAAQAVLSSHPELTIEYLQIREQDGLKKPKDKLEKSAVMLIAAKLGQTRLIDNIEFMT